MIGKEMPEIDPLPPEDSLELRELITIRIFYNIPEALFAKGCLESSGIECYLMDDNMVRLDWFAVNVIGGIKLKVSPKDQDTALSLLNRPYLVNPHDDEGEAS